MSVVLDESHTHSTTPQRKRSRQEQSCDAGSGPGSSDGSSGSGSSLSAGSMDDEDNEDNNRQVGSQKRARSEDHGNTDGPRGSVSWSRGNPPPLSSVHIRQSAGGTPTEGSPVDSLIPLPVVPPREARRDTEETIHIQPSSAHEDLARSMEFDQHMDVLRHSPAAGQQGSSNVDTAYDVNMQVVPEDLPSSNGRLHALADTAARISRSPAPAIDTTDEAAPIPRSRLRIFRLPEHRPGGTSSLSPSPQDINFDMYVQHTPTLGAGSTSTGSPPPLLNAAPARVGRHSDVESHNHSPVDISRLSNTGTRNATVGSSFWTGLFDESDSEREGSPAPQRDREDTNRRSTFMQDVIRDDLRRENNLRHLELSWSPQDSLGRSHDLIAPTTASSSSSSFASITRSSSRSLLDPSLRFGSAADSRLSWPPNLERSGPSLEWNTDGLGSRAGAPAWSHVQENANQFELGRASPGRHDRRTEDAIPFSSAFSTMNNDGTSVLPPSPHHGSETRSALRGTEPSWGRIASHRQFSEDAFTSSYSVANNPVQPDPLPRRWLHDVSAEHSDSIQRFRSYLDASASSRSDDLPWGRTVNRRRASEDTLMERGSALGEMHNIDLPEESSRRYMRREVSPSRFDARHRLQGSLPSADSGSLPSLHQMSSSRNALGSVEPPWGRSTDRRRVFASGSISPESRSSNSPASLESPHNYSEARNVLQTPWARMADRRQIPVLGEAFPSGELMDHTRDSLDRLPHQPTHQWRRPAATLSEDRLQGVAARTPVSESAPLSSLGRSSRLRWRLQLSGTPSPPNSTQPQDPMEDIIPESNARGGLSTSQTFEPLHMPVEPPPRPVEPRIPTIVSDPRPGNRLPPLLRSRSRSPSSLFPALMRQDDDSSDATHSPTIPTPAQQPRHAWHSRYRGARLDDGLVAERYLSHETTGYRHGSRGSLSRAPRSNSGVIFTPETFSELVRRRAARADARARADAQMRDATLSPSPETMSRAIHGPFRASQRFEERDAARHLERDARRDMHRNTDAPGLSSIFGRNAADQSSSMQRDRDLVRRELHAAGALDRSAGPRYTPDRSNSYLASMLADHERSGTFSRPQSSIPLHSEDEAGPIDRTTIERQRLPFAMGLPNMSSPFAHSSESDENIGSGSRDREQLREAISRRSRDDEDSRRPLSRLGRTRSVNSRDLMLDETTQILQRRLRESEVDPSRALRALDQWGELEGAGERDLGPSQSHIHRFGETMRQRRVPPAFAFGSMAMSDNSVSGASSSNSREVRRSPSPPGSTAVARLQARQARFARAQGRFRELGADAFGESRGRGVFASRLDMLGSRMASRFLSRSLGDYVRDEDFDASYENLVRLAAVVGDAKPRGTPAHLLAAMPTGFYKDFVVPGCETRCPICLDDYKDLDPVLRISDCDHWFHKECLEQWLQGARSCPLCKSVVRGRPRGKNSPPDDAPGPSGSRRDNGSDDEGPEGPSRVPESVDSPQLTLEELGSYAAGW